MPYVFFLSYIVVWFFFLKKNYFSTFLFFFGSTSCCAILKKQILFTHFQHCTVFFPLLAFFFVYLTFNIQLSALCKSLIYFIHLPSAVPANQSISAGNLRTNLQTNKQQKPRVQRNEILLERIIQINSSSVTRIFFKCHVFPSCLFNLLSCNWFIGGWISGDATVIEQRPSLCLRVVPPSLTTSPSIIPKQHKIIPQRNKMFSHPIFSFLLPPCCVLHKQRGTMTE